MGSTTLRTSLEAIALAWAEAGLPAETLQQIRLPGAEPALPSSFAVGTAAQAGIALAALAALQYWQLRSGCRQEVSVGMRDAAIECRSDHYFAIDGQPVEFHDPLTGLYRCGDGGWVRIHANFEHHREGALKLLSCAAARAEITAALDGHSAIGFEEQAAVAGLPVVALRSFAQWDTHPQGLAMAGLPLLSIARIGDGPACWTRAAAGGPSVAPGGGAAASPLLAGVRVLELTRILAGPVCGRTLAAYGADVMLVNSPRLPNIDAIADTSRGKLSTLIDLKDKTGCATMYRLLNSADVFLQGYRPDAIGGLGFGPEELAGRYPGLVYASLSAYGAQGPWRQRRGFDSLVQTAAGFNVAEAQAAGSATPKPLPTQILDHASGYLLAFGIGAALAKRATEGGSWHVQVSLAQTAHWLRSLGRVCGGFSIANPGRADVADLLETSDSGFGALTTVRHAAHFSRTPAAWRLPSMPIGAHPAAWRAI